MQIDASDATPMGHRTRWLALLSGVVLVVAGYGVLMVLAPAMVDRLLYAPLGFGSAQHGVTAAAAGHVGLITSVLGAVILGWATLLLAVIRGPLADGQLWAWRALAASAGVWFVADSGVSIAVGYATHAAFNLGVLLALGLPLWHLRPVATDRTS